MPKVLVIGNFHFKNKEGLNLMLSYLNYEYKWGSYKDIPNYDLIFLPSAPIDTSKFPTKKFIFGPHFSVFPTNKLLLINNQKNSIYIQPSDWVSQLWKDMKAEKFIPVKTLSFAVNMNKFKPINFVKDKVFIYFKSRKQEELQFLTTFLKKKNINYEIFDYTKRYNEKNYIKYLQESKYGIWLGRHESQGFALQEALSMDVPLLVWNVSSMSQEEGGNYQHIPATSIPYWDKRCGETFYQPSEFMNKYEEFISKLDTYKPREFILENLSVEKCAKRFLKLIS